MKAKISKNELQKVTCTVGTFIKIEDVKVKISKNELQKVTSTVGTFIKIEDVKAKISKNEPQKVTCTVGTFWKIEDVKVKISKNEPQKVTCTVGTFMNKDVDGLRKISVTTKEVYISSNPRFAFFPYLRRKVFHQTTPAKNL